MKLGRIEFAGLIAVLSNWGCVLDKYRIQDIDDIIDVPMSEVQHDYTSATDINTLMMLMAEGTRKIEAIKMHRKLTGYGLKESKEEVEKYWVSKGHYQSDANLGDILEQATKK